MGLLGDNWDDPRTMGTLGLAASLLAASGPSRSPNNLGAGLLAGLNAYQGSMNNAQQAELRKAQIEKMKAEAERFRALAAKGITPDMPAAVQTFEYFSRLNPDQQQEFMRVAGRRGYEFRLIGGVLHMINPNNPNEPPIPLTTLQNEASGQAHIAGTKRAAEETERARFNVREVYDPRLGRTTFTNDLNLLPGIGGGGAIGPSQPTPQVPGYGNERLPSTSVSSTPVPTVVAGGGGGAYLSPAERAPALAVQQAAGVARVQSEQKREDETPKAIQSARSSIGTGDNVFAAIDRAESKVNNWTAGQYQAARRNVPFLGQSVIDLANELETVKANIGFDRLQRMRFESPTGGALGQVAVQELVALRATIASLEQEQSAPQLRSGLKTVRDQYRKMMSSFKAAIAADEEFLRSRGRNLPAQAEPSGGGMGGGNVIDFNSLPRR